MGSSYRQFCPVSKAMELLDERWTMLVLRELILGSRRFNDLRRGLPKMSPALLSKRLSQLARAGLVERHEEGNEVHYVLTTAGTELRPIIEALGAWGVRWIGHLGPEDLDPQLLLWDLHRHVDRAATPAGRTVVQFQFPDVPARVQRWWLVITDDEIDVCDVDPGHEVDVVVVAELRCLTEVWRGDRRWADALATGAMVVRGPSALRRDLPRWFVPPGFASTPRSRSLPAPADEDRPQPAGAS